MKSKIIALLFASVALAGCASNSGNSEEPGENVPDDTSSGGNTDPVVTPMAPWSTFWYIDDDELVEALPDQSAVPMDCAWRSFTGTCNLSDYEFYGPEFEHDVYIESQGVELDLFLHSVTGGVGNPVFDIAGWFGSSRGSTAFGFTSVNFIAPGSITNVKIDLPFDDSPGLVLPAGERLMIRVLGAYEPEGGGMQHLMTGGATPSGFSLTVQNLTEQQSWEKLQDESFEGTAHGGAFIECAPGPEIHRFTVDENASFLNILMEATGPPGTPTDVDLDLYDGNTVIWHAGSPYAHEEILVAGSLLNEFRGEELGVGTTICLGGEANYSIDVLQG